MTPNQKPQPKTAPKPTTTSAAQKTTPSVQAEEQEAPMPKIEFDGSSELRYWWTPVTPAAALATEIATRPALAQMAVANLISMNPNYTPD